MPDPTPPPARTPLTPPRDATIDGVARVIRRGKARDRVFSWSGAILIVLSLGTLALLVARLVHDGGGHVFHSQEVKLDDQSPKMNELVGVLERRPLAPPADGKPADPNTGYGITFDRFPLDLSRYHIDQSKANYDAAKKKNPKLTLADVPPLKASDSSAAIAKLVGQKVVLTGTIYDAAAGPYRGYEVSTTTPLDPEKAKDPESTIPSGSIVGVVQKIDRAKEPEWPEFAVQFDPVRLDLTELDKDVKIETLVGKRVAVRPERSGRTVGVLPINDANELKKKPFVLSMPASVWYRAGIYSAAVGTLLIMLVTMLTTLPLGVAAGVYLEEYAPKNRLTAIIEINIANLAGVPSIIWGLLGLGLFVYAAHTGRSILAAGMTLGLLVLPIVLIATREAIRAIPGTIRDASIALGATKWQTVRNHVLPYSMGGILTGSIVALSRAIGETAPLIVIGAVVMLTSLPQEKWPYEPKENPLPAKEAIKAEPTKETGAAPAIPGAKPAAGPKADAADAAKAAGGKPDAGKSVAGSDDAKRPAAGEPDVPAPSQETKFAPLAWRNAQFTALPIQMFNWTSRPEQEFHRTAAAAGIILIVMTLSLNSVAIYMRARLRKKIKW